MNSKQLLVNENETFADVFDDFFWHYYNEYSVTDITNHLISENSKFEKYSDDYNHFWYAIAQAQWECNELDQAVYEKVKDIIENGHDHLLSKSIETTDQIISERKIALVEFYYNLQTKTKIPRISTQPYRLPAFKKGECITFKLYNENYGGAVVLEDDYRDGWNLIAITNINNINKPQQLDFEKADVLLRTFGNWNGKPAIHCYESTYHFKYVNLYETVCSTIVNLDYDIATIGFGISDNFENIIIDVANLQFKYELISQSSFERQSILNYTRKI